MKDAAVLIPAHHALHLDLVTGKHQSIYFGEHSRVYTACLKFRQGLQVRTLDIVHIRAVGMSHPPLRHDIAEATRTLPRMTNHRHPTPITRTDW